MTSRYLDLPRRDLDQVLRERTAITADSPDAFAAGGWSAETGQPKKSAKSQQIIRDEAAGDDAILALFAEWRLAKINEARISNEHPDADVVEDIPGWVAVAEKVGEIEDQIRAISASGAAGMAIKLYLNAAEEYACPNRPMHVAFSKHNYNCYGRMFDEVKCFRSLLADAVRFVPELDPFVAEAVAAPLQLDEPNP
jgi:hypothetical protein